MKPLLMTLLSGSLIVASCQKQEESSEIRTSANTVTPREVIPPDSMEMAIEPIFTTIITISVFTSFVWGASCFIIPCFSKISLDGEEIVVPQNTMVARSSDKPRLESELRERGLQLKEKPTNGFLNQFRPKAYDIVPIGEIASEKKPKDAG